MRRSMQVLLGLGLGVAVAGGGVGLIEATSSSSKAAPATAAKAVAPPAGSATVNVTTATVGGRSEQILVNARGLPLYTYGPDSPTQSHVSGGLAALWPPLVAASPSEAGATGKLSVIADRLGQQVLTTVTSSIPLSTTPPARLPAKACRTSSWPPPVPGRGPPAPGPPRQWRQLRRSTTAPTPEATATDSDPGLQPAHRAGEAGRKLLGRGGLAAPLETSPGLRFRPVQVVSLHSPTVTTKRLS